MARSFMREEPAVAASNAALGAWLRLYSYAAEVESGGVIQNSDQHDDRRWIALAMVTKAEVEETVSSGLCKWRGRDLIVEGYDRDGEKKVRSARRNGGNGGRPKTQTEPNGNPRVNSGLTEPITETKPSGEPSGNREANPTETQAKPLSGSSPILSEEERVTQGSTVDPLTAHGLTILVHAAVEREHPEIGLYNAGRWAHRTALEFLERIPEAKRTDASRAEIRQRIAAFAKSNDEWVRSKGWAVETFIERYSSLGRVVSAGLADRATTSSWSKYKDKPYLPPLPEDKQEQNGAA